MPGNVSLSLGAGANADAVLIANAGSGQIDITAGSCINCGVLGLDPFLDPASQAGLFGMLAFTLLESFVVTDTVQPDITEIMVLDDNLLLAWLELPGERAEGEEEEGMRILMCR